MKIYIPKIIANSPTKLPPLEKTILYYIIDKASKTIEDTYDLSIEIDINEILEIINKSSLDIIDIKSQTKQAINNLSKINLSLVDNNFHIKVLPVESVYLDATTLYATLSPIIVEYFDQILLGNYLLFDLLTNSLVDKTNLFNI